MRHAKEESEEDPENRRPFPTTGKIYARRFLELRRTVLSLGVEREIEAHPSTLNRKPAAIRGNAECG